MFHDRHIGYIQESIKRSLSMEVREQLQQSCRPTTRLCGTSSIHPGSPERHTVYLATDTTESVLAFWAMNQHYDEGEVKVVSDFNKEQGHQVYKDCPGA